MGSVRQVQTGVSLERLPIVSLTTPFQYGHHTYADLCKRHVDTHAKTRKMIKTAQRKMLRLIIQTKRNYKTTRKASSKKDEEPEVTKDKDNENMSEKDTEDESQEDSNKDQDSDVSLQEEADEEIDATENEEDWIEFIRRNTKEEEEHMEKHKIPCWIEVHRRSNWRMALRFVSLPQKR